MRTPLRAVWAKLLEAGVALACARHLLAEFQADAYTAVPAGMLAAAAFGTALWRPHAAAFGLIAAVPLLSALAKALLITVPDPVSVAASGILLGWMAHGLRRRSLPASGIPDAGRRAGAEVAALDVLLTIVLASLAATIIAHRAHPDLQAWLLRTATFGFGEQGYFLASALLWMQGLFFFRLLRTDPPSPPLYTWVVPLLCIHAVVFLGCLAVQGTTGFPPGGSWHGISWPLEDISSYGSIAVAFLAVAGWCDRGRIGRADIARGALAAAFLAMAIASWSRAAWIAALLVMLALVGRRFGVKWIAVPLGLAVVVAILVNRAADGAFVQSHPYLIRLAALTRIESLEGKITGRSGLHRKAAAMIADRPVTGHGIGSFYRKSTAYAAPGDPLATRPDFAHNVFLQVGAELGAPAALALALVFGLAIQAGFKATGSGLAARDGWTGPPVRAGVALALLAYLLTQMTANSFNVYPTNQVLIWFLAAAALS